MKGKRPFLNIDLGYRDQSAAFYSNMPIGADFLSDYHILFDDFLEEATYLDEVKDASATIACGADLENGALVITSNATTDDDGGLVQVDETSFFVKSGKKLWFEARIKVSDADQCDMFIGLADTAATDPEAVVAEGLARVGFELVDGSAVLKYVTDNDTAATKTSSGVSAADDTYVRLGFRTDGGHIRFYVNRALVGSAAIPSAIAAVTLGPAFFGLSGNATGTHTRTMDYWLVIQER